MGVLADAELSAADIEGAAQEIALSMGPEVGASDVLNAAHQLAGGDRSDAAMANALAQIVTMSGGYADDGVLTEGHRRLPCDSPDAVRRSWREVCREAHRYSAADLAAVKQTLMDAAAGFGFQLHDPDGGAALSGGQLDDWGNTVASYYDYNAGPGGMAAPQGRSAADIAQRFVKAYSPEWYEAERLAAASRVQYDPANPDHMQLAADGVAGRWAEDEALRLSETFAAGANSPRRPPSLTTDRAEAEAIRLTNALYAPKGRSDARHRPLAERVTRDRNRRRQAETDQLELAHALADNPYSDEALRLSAGTPGTQSYMGQALPPSRPAYTDPRVAGYLSLWNNATSTKAQRAQARSKAGKFHTGVISQGDGTDQNGLQDLDPATVLDLKDLARQWADSTGELQGYDPNQSYAPGAGDANAAGRTGYKPGT